MIPDVKASYVTSPEAARILGITYVGVAQLVRQGKIPAVKIANRWLIPRDFVEEYAKTYQGRRGRPRTKHRHLEPQVPETLANVHQHVAPSENLASAAPPTEQAPLDSDAIPEAEDVKVEAAPDFAVKVHVDYLDENYDFEVYEKGELTEHARLIVARLRPKIATLPHFSFRWDYRYDHLNVDIHGVGMVERDWFREGRHGYGGHLPRRLGDPERTFEPNIWLPGTHVFRGRMSFTLRKYAETLEERPPTPGITDRLRSWRRVIGGQRPK